MAKDYYMSEIQNYNSVVDTPNIFISKFDDIQVIFLVVYESAPHAIDTCENTHAHNSFEIQYVSENSADLLIDNSREITLHAGDLMLVPHNMLHKTFTNPKKFSRYSINFSIVSESEGSDVSDGRTNFYERVFSKLSREVVFRNEEIRHCFEKIFELGCKDSYSKSCSKLYLNLIFEEITNFLNLTTDHIKKEDQLITQCQINSMRKWLIDAYISDYYMCKEHVENLSCILNLSPRQTSRVVKELTGKGLQEAILDHRMSVAIETLRYTKLSLNQISEMLGYSTYSGFYLAFRKCYGFSPETLRGNDNGGAAPL